MSSPATRRTARLVVGSHPTRFSLEGAAVVTPDVQPVLAAQRANHRQHDIGSVHKAAGGTPAALHLHDSWRGEGDGVGE